MWTNFKISLLTLAKLILQVNIDLEYALTENITFGLNYENMGAMTDTDHDLNGTPDSFK